MMDRRIWIIVAMAVVLGELAGGPVLTAGTIPATTRDHLGSKTEYVDPDMFAVEAQSGPDFWKVTGVASGDTLNMRSGPGTGYKVVARAPDGTVLRNLGCQGTGASRWCKVETKDGTVRGWVKGTFLTESGGGVSSGSTVASNDVPEIAVRSSGEIEVRWSAGCTMLYNAKGARIQSGGSCTRSQRNYSDDAVAGYLREQGAAESSPAGGSGKFSIGGAGLVVDGGPVVGRIFSKKGHKYSLVLTATKDGFTCSGSFDSAPGGSQSMTTVIQCTNGAKGSAVLKGDYLTFGFTGHTGWVKFGS